MVHSLLWVVQDLYHQPNYNKEIKLFTIDPRYGNLK